MNWTLFNDTAWDFAADTRGYTDGVMLAWVDAGWSLRYGVYRMPWRANGQRLVPSLRKARGEQVELTVQPDPDGWALRLLAFRNTASMGVYRQAIDTALATGSVPDITADDHAGRHKYGVGLNGELPLADHGDTGLFMRAGWNDGHTESFAFTEVDRTFSGGFQLSGAHWNRPGDHLGVGVAFNALSPGHRAYLALGGDGFVLGDGTLRYGRERLIEAYYNVSISKYLTLSPDLQLVHNPGYNRDRGPARFVALRAHLEL
jgi:carbohydrate-selective porin OprB